MALDVHLTRDKNERWGFELYGGADDEIPLTIEKIQPSSPAERAGLQNGDTILTINGEEAIDITHEEASRMVAECEDIMTLGVMRGLYNIVLDDTEPLYFEQGDLDPQSQPTEVPFQIQQFVEPEDLGSKLIDYGTSTDPCGTPFDPSVLLTDRSLTASPFVTPTKPYRPFSTEPISEVPSLEDPIILNPDFKDQFGETPVGIIPDYILNGDGAIQAKFKLPISEQYDPDGTKCIKNVEIDSVLSKYTKMEQLSKISVTIEAKITKTNIKDEKVSEKTSKDVKINEVISLIAKDNKETVKNKETLSKLVKEDLTAKDVHIKEEMINNVESLKTDVKLTEKHVSITETMEEEMVKEELKQIERTKAIIDVSQIEETALSIVEDSIERAVSVTEEIKKEIEEETTSAIENIETSKVESQQIEKSSKSDVEINESSELIQSKVLESQSKTEEVSFENVERRKKYLEDTEKRVVKKDIVAEEEETEKVFKRDSKAFKSATISTEQYSEGVTDDLPSRKESFTKATDYSETKGEYTKVTKTMTADNKTSAQERSYAIGLQTIPNIRGVVHSSYHYDLLLRTFFLHLTDVMVALSRFVLTQPIFNTECSRACKSETQTYGKDIRKSEQEIVKSERVNRQVEAKEEKREARQVHKPVTVQETLQTKVGSQKTEKDMKVREKMQKRELITPIPVEEVKIESCKKVKEAKIHQETKTDLKDTKNVEKLQIKEEQKKEEVAIVAKSDEKKITGAQMAQRTEKKVTKDVTQKMDAVISEFQTIAVEEDKIEMLQRNRRSRSRSQIEEEVAKESDPLEWLSKVDSRRASQEISEERLSKKEYLSSETTERKQYEKLEKQEIRHKKSKTPKQMYIAVVESHVYTNKDVIFEDIEEFSETSSVQSAEEVNTAFEAIEAMSTENVAIENAVREIEQAKVVEESQQLVSVEAQNAATVQKSEEIVQESSNIQHEEYKHEIAEHTIDVQETVVQEIKEIIEPVVEIKETIKQESAKVNINKSLNVAESSEINIHESKSEFTCIESKKESVAIVEENYRQNAVVESKGVVGSKIEEVIQPPPQIEEISENIVLKSDKDYKKEEEYAALKIVKKVETEIESTNELIEIEEEIDVSSNQETIVSKIQMAEALVLDESKSVSSKISSSEIGIATLESKTDISSSKQIEIESKQSKIDTSSSKIQSQSYQSQSMSKESHSSEDFIQESSFTAKVVDKKLSIRTDLDYEKSLQSSPSTIDTPTPSTIPPTPLTDEYVFKLSIPLPKSRGTTPIPRDCTLSPQDEDPHIVKKKLIPHIETSIEKVVYDPPLPTPPPGGKLQSPIFKTPGLFGGAKPVYKIKFPPVYRKPGLYGGGDNLDYTKEEIREIERKSSLLASAIDQTIKSIEEYKEEVGMEKKKDKITETRQTCYIDETVSIKIESPNGFEESNNIEINEKIINNNITIEEMDQEITNNINIKEEKNTLSLSEDNTNTDVRQRSPSIETSVRVFSDNQIKRDIIKTDLTTLKFENNEEDIKKRDFSIENGITEYKIPKPVVTEHETITNIPEPVVIEYGNEDIKVEETPEPVSDRTEDVEVKEDPLLRVRPVVFDPNSIQKRGNQHVVTQLTTEARQSPYMTDTGEIIGTIQGIVDGLEDPVMDSEVAKELGKPGISEQKIAELISGEAEMLREAHVMGLTRVITSHMHRVDDSSVDFQKIKPMIGSLKDSEVLKALNEELARQKEEERKKEEKKWTTFLQKPRRPVPKAKFGYHGWSQNEQALVAEPYQVKIVKQAKPKVAPDYKPEDFETGPLPWEQRAELEEALPPVEAEEPILIPEVPEFLEAVDPLKESEVPDLEDTGLPLPPPKEPTPPPEAEEQPEEEPTQEQLPEIQEEEVTQQEETQKETREDMENKLADQLVRSVQGMVDPNAPVDQQLAQMRAQLAALAQLPEVIQQTLSLVSQQLNKMTHQEACVEVSESRTESHTQEMEVIQNHVTEVQEERESEESIKNEIKKEEEETKVIIEEVQEKKELEELKQEIVRVETPQISEEEMRMEKMKKDQQQHIRLESEARQIKQRSTPRVGKPKRVFGPPDPDCRPVVLPGGRRWRKTEDVYNEQMFAETLQAQSELIMGKALGFESDLLPYDSRINFMKYEKPPVSLDHLQNSATYKLVHDMDQTPVKRVELLTPVIAEADYRERCRSITPAGENHQQIPQQFHP